MDFNQFNLLIGLGREYGHACIRDLSVSDTGHRICTFLHFHGAVSQETAASSLMLDKTTLAKAVSTLVDKGLVTRTADPDNRRKNLLRLTDAGRETIQDNADIYDRWLSAVCACLTEAEQRQLSELLIRMVESAIALRPLPAGCKPKEGNL